MERDVGPGRVSAHSHAKASPVQPTTSEVCMLPRDSGPSPWSAALCGSASSPTCLSYEEQLTHTPCREHSSAFTARPPPALLCHLTGSWVGPVLTGETPCCPGVHWPAPYSSRGPSGQWNPGRLKEVPHSPWIPRPQRRLGVTGRHLASCQERSWGVSRSCLTFECPTR